MKTLVLTDELAYKLHTLYKYYDESKHHFKTQDEIEDELELVYELVEEYHNQESK